MTDYQESPQPDGRDKPGLNRLKEFGKDAIDKLKQRIIPGSKDDPLTRYMRMSPDELRKTVLAIEQAKREKDPEKYEIQDAVNEHMTSLEEVFRRPMVREEIDIRNKRFPLNQEASRDLASVPQAIKDEIIRLEDEEIELAGYRETFDEFRDIPYLVLEERLKYIYELSKHHSDRPVAKELVKGLIDKETLGVEFGRYIEDQIPLTRSKIAIIDERIKTGEIEKTDWDYVNERNRLWHLEQAKRVFQKKFPQYTPPTIKEPPDSTNKTD